MPRRLTPTEGFAVMNLLVKQATGRTDVTVTDTSSFVSAGELVMATGMENVYNSLSIVLNRLIVASRPYSAKINLMETVDSGAYSNRARKISFYAKDALPSGHFNTDLYTNLADGFTAGENKDANGDPQSTKSQWEQHQAIPLEMSFGGCTVWQDAITLYEDQVQLAFRTPEEFASFVSGFLTEHANDIESQREAWNRMNLLNKIASVYDMQSYMPGSVINLTAAFNEKFSTSYTSEELRTTYLKDFLAFFVSEFKLASKFMTERTKNYHWSPAKQVNGVDYDLLRHTPYDKQRVYLYSPLFTEAEAQVLPEIFRPEYLDIGTQYQEVTYWQGVSDRAAINVTPAIIDVATGQQTAGAPVSIPYVVGMIADVDALMTNFMIDTARSTPLEARKGYRTIWNNFCKNQINDPTENCVIFTMEDED